MLADGAGSEGSGGETDDGGDVVMTELPSNSVVEGPTGRADTTAGIGVVAVDWVVSTGTAVLGEETEDSFTSTGLPIGDARGAALAAGGGGGTTTGRLETGARARNWLATAADKPSAQTMSHFAQTWLRPPPPSSRERLFPWPQRCSPASPP